MIRALKAKQKVNKKDFVEYLSQYKMFGV